MLSRRPWRLVLGIWGTYWLGLAAFTLVPLLRAVYRATTAPENQGSVNVAYNTATGFGITVVREGQTIYSSSVSLIALALWIAGPPLLAWIAVATASRRDAREAASV